MLAWTVLEKRRKDCQIYFLLAVVFLLTPLDSTAGIRELNVINDLPQNAIFIDTRPSQDCKQQSVSGASCLSPEQLLYPDGHLASFRDINWLLGTLAVDASKPIIVIGDNAMDRRFVAGILYLTGLSEITISSVSVTELFGLYEAAQGRQRGILRVSYIDRPMRDKPLLLDSDLAMLLDKPDNKVSTLADNVWLLKQPDSDQIVVTALEPRAAINWFVQLLITRTNSGDLFVHIDGLSAPFKSRLINLGAEVS